MPDRCVNRHKKWQLNLYWKTCASRFWVISLKTSVFQKSQLMSINCSSALHLQIWFQQPSEVAGKQFSIIFCIWKSPMSPFAEATPLISIAGDMLFHSFLGVYVCKIDTFMYVFFSSLVTSNPWRAFSINSVWQNVLYAPHRSFFYLLWHECELKWMYSIFPRTPFSAVSARVGFCKWTSYVLITAELEVRLRLTLSRCALVVRSGHQTPALSSPDDTAQRSTRTGTTDGSVLLQTAGAQEFVAQVLLFAQTSQERLVWAEEERSPRTLTVSASPVQRWNLVPR